MKLKPSVYVVSESDTEQLWKNRGGEDEFLASMRALGAEKIESIRALRHHAGLSLEEAKKRVHFSQTWADTRAADDFFHDTVLQALEGDGWSSSSSARERKIA